MTPAQVSSLHHSALSSSGFQWFGFSSSASPEPNDKETAAHSGNEKENKESNDAPTETEECNLDEKSRQFLFAYLNPHILDFSDELMY